MPPTLLWSGTRCLPPDRRALVDGSSPHYNSPVSSTLPEQEDTASAPAPRSLRRWWPPALVLLICCLAVIHQRNRIRAYWWASRLVQTEDLGARGYYLASLAAVGEMATGAIERLSRNEDPEVRVLAIFPLKSLPQEDALPVLRRLLDDSDMDVRESAAVALAFMSSPGARAVLRETAVSQAKGAATAAGALGRSQDPSDMETLCQVLAQHPSPAVRAQAAESIAALLLGEDDPGEAEAAAAMPDGCDPFLALVHGLADGAMFAGSLSLEREVAAAARFVRRQGRRVEGVGSAQDSASAARRRVADVAAKGLSSLTGRVVTPLAEQSAAQQAVFADRCRRWYLQRLHPPSGVENPPSASPGSSDTPTSTTAQGGDS